MRKRIFWKFY